jgi:hypothetical protein
MIKAMLNAAPSWSRPFLLGGSTAAKRLRVGGSAAQQVRNHMNHGGGGGGGGGDSLKPPSVAGPRTGGVEIGLDSATGVHNILRLLESSHGQYAAYTTADTLSTVWHPSGKIWRHDEEEGWKVYKVGVEELPVAQQICKPSLLSISMSDNRTALAKIVGSDGLQRYLSLLKLDEFKPNDGWIIVREVVSASGTKKNYHTKSLTSVKRTVQDYFAIEHGGGLEDKEAAEKLFDPNASLLTVGSEDHHSKPTAWNAPAGTFLEIPLATYLDGVLSQTTQDFEATLHDDIVSIDVMPCGNAAAATVRVGNGAKTRVFEDHLLLGRSYVRPEWAYWRILSKTFSPQPWPCIVDDEGHEVHAAN